MKDSNDMLIYIFLIANKSHYNLTEFIEKRIPITAEAFQYFFEYDRINLFSKYQNITSNTSEIQYHTLLPIYSNGIPKSILNYRDLFLFDNINIKHFTSYLNNGDKHEHDKSRFLIQSLNGQTKIDKNRKTNFTLIYLIGISSPSRQILNQISALSHPEVAFIIFIDNKSNRNEHYEILSNAKDDYKFENVYIIDSPRFIVSWAHITQAFSQLVMNQAALKFFPNSLYLSFHSESDYPIAPNEYIVKYLKKNYPNNYMITFTDLKKKSYRKDLFRLIINHHVNDILVKVMHKLFPKKIVPKAEWRCGWNWFTITLNDSKKMIDVMFNKFEIINCLDYVQYADEIIFSTLAKEANVTIMNNYLRFIDWTGCNAHPLVLTERNFNDIISQNCSFWARKFTFDESSKLMKMIDKYIKKIKNNNSFRLCDVK